MNSTPNVSSETRIRQSCKPYLGIRNPQSGIRG